MASLGLSFGSACNVHPGKLQVDGSNGQVPATYVGKMDGVLSSWPWTDALLVITDIVRDQANGRYSLYLYLFLIKQKKIIKNIY